MKNSFFKILIVLLFPFFSLKASDSIDVEFSGVLVKKYYNVSKFILEQPFGWFVELDDKSKAHLNAILSNLDSNEKEICACFDTNIIQLVFNNKFDVKICYDFENQFVHTKGKFSNFPNPYQAIPSHQLVLTELKNTEFEKSNIEEFFTSFYESLKDERSTYQFKNIDNKEVSDIPLELFGSCSPEVVTLEGILQLKICSGPPNYESIESGDYPERCWIIQMDSESFEIASHTLVLEPALSMVDILSFSNPLEVQLGFENDMTEFCESHINQKVTVEGYLSHAILAHHHTPFLISVQSVEKHRCLK